MFDSLFAEVRSQDRQFTVYRSGTETGIESQFETHNVAVSHRELPPAGPEPFLVIEDGDGFAGAVPVAEFEGLLEPPIVRPESREDVSKGFDVLFDVLDDTLFTSLERSQLLAVSREIEDRAARVGAGTLRACFQGPSTFEPQAETYRWLATETELDIHLYGVGDRPRPEIPGVTVHSPDALEPYWILAFDGGAEETQACGLVAREREGGYEGFWTYDIKTVRDILSRIA